MRVPFVLTQSDLAAILDELDFLKDQLARLPTRAEVRWIALRLTLATRLAAALAHRQSEQRSFEGSSRQSWSRRRRSRSRCGRARCFTAYLSNGGVLEHAQEMAAHESPRTTKLYDRTKERLTQDEVERIRL